MRPMIIVAGFEFKWGFVWGLTIGMGIVASVGNWLLHRKPKQNGRVGWVAPAIIKR